jgi:hypothetical protein
MEGNGGEGEGEGMVGCSFGGSGSNSFGDGWLGDDGISRPSPLTIPHVIVPDNPKGLPIATTCSPILSCDEFPKGNGESLVSDIFSICNTEISLNGSDATSLALNADPSWNVTIISSVFAAVAITW